MARTRQFSEQRADAYKLADLEGFTDRYPASEVGRYINQGNAECWDLLVANRGFSYFGKPYWELGTPVQVGLGPAVTASGALVVGTATAPTVVVTISLGGILGVATFTYTIDGVTSSAIVTAATYALPAHGITLAFAAGTHIIATTHTFTAAKPVTVSAQQTYALPTDFYKLHQLYLSDGTTNVVDLEPVNHVDKPHMHALAGTGATLPRYYEIRSGYYDLWPQPGNEYTVNLWYVPTAIVLVNDTDTFDGINGWEDYGCHWAARKMLLKEGDIEMANLVTQDINKLGGRITNMSADRDAGSPSRVQDVRGALAWSRSRKRYYGRA